MTEFFRTKERCGKCGASLVFDHTDNKGTIVKFSGRGQQILRNATMPFVWVYFNCSMGCDWRLCTFSTSKDIDKTLCLKEKTFNLIGKLLFRHLHYFHFYGLSEERFAYTNDHKVYHSRDCRCGLREKRVFVCNQEGEVMYSKWKNISEEIK